MYIYLHDFCRKKKINNPKRSKSIAKTPKYDIKKKRIEKRKKEKNNAPLKVKLVNQNYLRKQECSVIYFSDVTVSQNIDSLVVFLLCLYVKYSSSINMMSGLRNTQLNAIFSNPSPPLSLSFSLSSKNLSFVSFGKRDR